MSYGNTFQGKSEQQVKTSNIGCFVTLIAILALMIITIIFYRG